MLLLRICYSNYEVMSGVEKFSTALRNVCVCHCTTFKLRVCLSWGYLLHFRAVQFTYKVKRIADFMLCEIYIPT